MVQFSGISFPKCGKLDKVVHARKCLHNIEKKIKKESFSLNEKDSCRFLQNYSATKMILSDFFVGLLKVKSPYVVIFLKPALVRMAFNVSILYAL